MLKITFTDGSYYLTARIATFDGILQFTDHRGALQELPAVAISHITPA